MDLLKLKSLITGTYDGEDFNYNNNNNDDDNNYTITN